jgi:hypothetical protein
VREVKPVTTVSSFPDLIKETASMPLWGKSVSTTYKRDKKLQPSLMSKTGYTSTHYLSGSHNDNSYMKDYVATVDVVDSDVQFASQAKKRWRALHYMYSHIILPEYRSGSFENALWGLSNGGITCRVFVQAIISEFKFSRKLRMEEYLERLYTAFPGSSTDAVDYRLILCSYLNLILFQVIPVNIKHLFLLMYDIFTEPFSDQVHRHSVLSLISVCAMSTADVEATAGRLDAALTDLAPTHLLKPNFRIVEKKFLLEVFETHPGILLAFKEQCWGALSDEQRLHVLAKKEDESSKGFEYQDFKFKARQALQLWTRALLAKSFRTWDEYKEEILRVKAQRLWMLYRSAKRRMSQWRIQTEANLAKRERIKIARAMGKLIVKRARFLKWKRVVVIESRIKRGCNRYDEKFKRYGDGLGHLRYSWYRWKARLLLQRWDDETKFMARVEYATKWAAAKFKERNWKAFKVYIRQRIIEKYKELDAADRRQWLTNLMKSADDELKELKRKKEEEMLQKKLDEEREEAAERARRKLLQAQRRKAERGADDRYILEIQREDRRKRVEAEHVLILEEWTDEWIGENKKRRTFNPKRQVYKKRFVDDDESTVECWRCGREGHVWRQCWSNSHIDGIHVYKKGETLEDVAEKHQVSVENICDWNHIDSHKDLEPEQNISVMNIDDGNWHAQQHKEPGENWTWDMVGVCRARVLNWLASKEQDAKERMAKSFKELKREFYQPPTIETVYREEMLQSEANIALAIIDGKLFARGLLGQELFEKFDESGDGYITFEEMVRGIEEMELNVEHSWIRSLFKNIDESGDGYISIDELHEALALTYQYNGARGSPWKMYTSPAHQIMCFHNVVTEVMVFEHEMTDSLLKEIVRCNIIAEKEFAERELILQVKRKDLKDRKQHYAALRLQFLYWKWTALRDMRKQRWKLEQHELSVMRKEEKKYAQMWQNAFRVHMAKKASWFNVQMHYQKMVDLSEDGRMYYFNHLTGDRSWDKPKIFFLFLGMSSVTDLDEPHPWTIEYTPAGQQIWFNRDTGDVIEGTDDGFGTWEPPKKPPGYPICQNCNLELGWRDCKQCQFQYCFQCFRLSHNYVGANKHTWTMVKPVECELCQKAVAGKRAKGKAFCLSCFTRLEKSGVFRGKVASKTIEDI